MKVLNFFIIKLFLRKPILVISMIALIFLTNYLVFTSSRSITSTIQGYKEIEVFNKEGNFISNLNPDTEADFEKIELDETRAVYDYIHKHYKFAFESSGFIIPLNNKEQMEVILNYVNEEFYKTNHIDLLRGHHLTFDFNLENEYIPVLIGYGLKESYQIGSIISIDDPATQQKINFKVEGILSKDTYRSNFYAPNSKNYLNFSMIIPVNKEYIDHSGLDLQVNGLMDMVIVDSTRAEVNELSQYIKKHTDLDFNFFSQEENFEYFEDYYGTSLKVIFLFTILTLLVVISLALWVSLMGTKLMIKDFTINLLVGLSYSKLRTIFYTYFSGLFFVNVLGLIIISVYSRYLFWLTKNTIFATYGTLGLIGIDWLAVLMVIIIDIILGILIVEISIQKIKKIPISLGVLQ